MKFESKPGMGKIILCRHGQTAWNRISKAQGRLDSPLTAKGCQQAFQMGVAVSFLLDSLEAGDDYMFYSSPQGRAMQTSTIISDVIESDFQNIHTHDALKEGDMGCVAGLERGEWDQFFPVETAYRQGNKWRNAFPGGESYKDIAKRVNDHFLNLVSGNEISVVVTHEMVSKSIRGLVGDISLEKIPTLSHSQDSVYLLDLATREIKELDTSPRACGTENGCGGCEGC